MGPRVDQNKDSLYVQELFAASLGFLGPLRNVLHTFSEISAKEGVECGVFGYLAPLVIGGS